MENIILVLNRTKIKTAIVFLILMSIITIAPLFRNQIITGSIVNAILFLSVIILGLKTAIIIGIIPSIIALFTGILSPILMPLIPYIILSNIILVYSFYILKNKNYWLSIIVSSFLKFLFLFTISNFVIRFIIKEEVVKNIAVTMSYPQLITALTGGFIAYIILKKVNKKVM